MKIQDKNEKAPEADIVVSSRVRLARNLKTFVFSSKLDSDQAAGLTNTFLNLAKKAKGEAINQLRYIDSSILSQIEKACLVEKHLISREFANKEQNTALMINEEETLSVMINEEDHIRMQAILPGLQLDQSWNICNTLDSELESVMDYAYSDELGYLTACPSNVGTGMRVSVMVHLPALTLVGYHKKVLDSITKVGVSVRGMYGEGSEFMGNIYQLSNQITLGQSEEEIINKINILASKVIQQEKAAREKILKNRLKLEDRLYRAYGIFSNARILSSNECMQLLSDVRLGVELGIIKNIKIETINDFMVITQPANLQSIYGTTLTPAERDEKRAEIIREKINSQ